MKINSKYRLQFLVGVWIVAVACAILAVFIERQNINDWIALYDYQPPQSVSSLAKADGMTSYTRKVFYVNHPLLEPKTVFARVCPSNSEQTVVLGCYHLNQQGIFILSVNNPELNGIEQVTAAYETLHAVYQRLSSSAVSQLNNELLSYEYHGLKNSVVISQIAVFKKTEPGEVLNEMTSLFGTEVQSLPQSLNSFYAKYFTNRQTVVKYYDSYESAFLDREQQITAYDNQLTSLKTAIYTEEASLTTQLEVIQSQQENLKRLKNDTQISEYNQQVPGYNLLINNYNKLVASVTNSISQYNQIVSQRNSLSLEEQQLTASITSTTQPLTK